jgi:glycosyltransferase involved in cell wall biosynthesis
MLRPVVRGDKEQAQYAISSSNVQDRPIERDAGTWLFVNGAMDFGGHEVMLKRWVEELRAHGHVQPVVLARAGTRFCHETQEFSAHEDLAPVKLTGGRTPRDLIDMVRDAFAFARVVRRSKPRLCVVAEGCPFAQPTFVMMARLLGLPVVIYVPLVEESRKMGFRRGRLRDALVKSFYADMPHGWVTLTRAQAEHFATWTGLRKPVLSLPNTTARDYETGALARVGRALPRAPAAGEPLRVLVLGRLEAHQKGLDLLIDHLLQHPPPPGALAISLVGSGPYERELRRKLAESPDVAASVSLVPWSDAVDVMATHDVLLMTSRYEGVPLVMLEAMALGLPVVAPDLPGTRAYLDAECLFAVGDIGRAFEIVRRVAHPALRQRVAERNRTIYAAKASYAAFSSAVSALTQELMALPPQRRA